VRAGLWHYSDLGLGAGLGWTHRNILGAGQELRLAAAVSENLQQADTELMLPNFGHPGQSLGLSAQYKNEITDVYDATNLTLSAIARRPVSDLQAGYGLAYRLSRVDEDGERRFNLVSLPLILEYAGADNPLEPTSGLALAVRMAPFASIEERGSSFVLWNVSARHYLPLRKDNSLILATRGRYSLLAGTRQGLRLPVRRPVGRGRRPPGGRERRGFLGGIALAVQRGLRAGGLRRWGWGVRKPQPR
jgi:translocation and assembly module TamA